MAETHSNLPKFGTGHTKSAKRNVAYGSWRHMVARCRNSNDISWPLYGGRGIQVCERWLTFSNFLADMGERPPKHTIDRIDNDGDYEPGNCRWATDTEQANNKSSSTLLTFQGKTQSLALWGREVGIPATAITRRLSLGWSVERTLTEPSAGLGQVLIEFRGERMLKWHFAALIGMASHNVYLRFNQGMSAEEIAAAHVRDRLMVTIGSETLTVAEWGRRSGIDRRLIKYRIKKGWEPHDAVFQQPRKSPHGMDLDGVGTDRGLLPDRLCPHA